MTEEAIPTILVFGIFALFLLFLGWRKGFFALPLEEWKIPLRFTHLIGAFAIYFLVNLFASGFVLSFLRGEIRNNYIGSVSWLNFSVSLLIFFSLALYLSFLPSPLRKGLIRRSWHPLREDFAAAFYTWLLSFPFVLFFNQLLEWVISNLFHITQVPDQLAVKFLKSTFNDPLYFFLATLSIIILAPLIEETLFRGFLQGYIRKHLGSKQAILITSVCFALFHYAAGQGLANIPIILSLFVFSLFLGFVCEKQGSLFASMALHSLFNTISVINLYLFGGFITGL